MANSPFDLEIINALERPLSSDINLVSSYSALQLREFVKQFFSTRTSESNDVSLIQPPSGTAAFFGSCFRVRGQGVSMQVTLDPGLGFWNNGLSETALFSISGLNDASFLKPMVLNSAMTITGISNGDAANPRIDIVEVKMTRAEIDTATRDVLVPATGVFNPSSVFKTLDYSFDGSSQVISSGGTGTSAVVYKMGVPGVSPSAPATDAGYMVIAQVRVPALATSVAANYVSDFRRLLLPNGMLNISGEWLTNGSNSTCALSKLSAPAGVQVAIGVPSGNTWTLYVVPGDASLFDSTSYNIVSNFMNWVNPGVGQMCQLRQNTIALATADLTAQTAMAASSPALSVGIGQKYLKGFYNTPIDSNADTPNTIKGSFSLSAQY